MPDLPPKPEIPILFRDHFDLGLGLGTKIKYKISLNGIWDKKVPFLYIFSLISDNSYFA